MKKKDKLLDAFKAWELDETEQEKYTAGQTPRPEPDEFQITVPIFNYTVNIIRDCFDGTSCSYITYSDDGKGGIHESFAWDE